MSLSRTKIVLTKGSIVMLFFCRAHITDNKAVYSKCYIKLLCCYSIGHTLLLTTQLCALNATYNFCAVIL
jgi:hypothetical protein